VDVEPLDLAPAWRNNVLGQEAIANILECFLVYDALLSKMERYRTWMGVGGGSNHFPIYLQLEKEGSKPTTPFKFNPIWMVYKEFCNMVTVESL
jgi:hypothetical protein